VLLEKCRTNTRALWSWKDFPVYKYNGIPFDAHLTRSHILIILAKFSLRNGIFLFSLKRLNYCPRLAYIFKQRCFVLGSNENMLIVEVSLVSQYIAFLQRILRDITYYTFNTIYWQNIFSKTNVCICFSEIKHKTILWNKAHHANKTICHMEANECMLTRFFSRFFFKF